MDEFKKIVENNGIEYIPKTDSVKHITREQLYNCMQQAQDLIKESKFKTYDTSQGHCCFCGKLGCNGRCFK